MPTPYNHTDLAYSTLASGPYSPGATAVTVQAGKGALFPTGNFKVTIWDEATYGHAGKDPNAEIRTCSSRTGDVLTIDALVNSHVNGEGITQSVYSDELNAFPFSDNAFDANVTVPIGKTLIMAGDFNLNGYDLTLNGDLRAI